MEAVHKRAFVYRRERENYRDMAAKCGAMIWEVRHSEIDILVTCPKCLEKMAEEKPKGRGE